MQEKRKFPSYLRTIVSQSDFTRMHRIIEYVKDFLVCSKHENLP